VAVGQEGLVESDRDQRGASAADAGIPRVDHADVAPSPTPLDDRELRIWVDFLRVATYSIDLLDRELVASHELHLADYEILVALSAQPERRLAMSALAERALVSASRLTYRVDRLVAAGLVERRPCEHDGRRTWAILTDDGHAKLEAAYPIHLAGVRRYLIDPPEREDLDGLKRSLAAMLRSIADVRDVPEIL
jgi:DNA-binding MarR family transcriptional regulator